MVSGGIDVAGAPEESLWRRLNQGAVTSDSRNMPVSLRPAWGIQNGKADRPHLKQAALENGKISAERLGWGVTNSTPCCELFARILSALLMPIDAPASICLTRLLQRFMISLAKTEAVAQQLWFRALDIDDDPPHANEMSARRTIRSCWLEERCIPTVTTFPSDFAFRDGAIDG